MLKGQCHKICDHFVESIWHMPHMNRQQWFSKLFCLQELFRFLSNFSLLIFCFVFVKIFEYKVRKTSVCVFFLDQMYCLPTARGAMCVGSVVPSSRYGVCVISVTYCIVRSLFVSVWNISFLLGQLCCLYLIFHNNLSRLSILRHYFDVLFTGTGFESNLLEY